MDPLSLTASVVGLTATCVQTAKAVNDLRGKYRDAPTTLATICTEITIICASLSQLQNIILRDPEALVSKLSERADLENTFDAALMGCVAVFDNLQIEIQKVKGDKDQDGANMGFRARMRWLGSESSIKDILGQLRDVQTALTLLLQLLGTESVFELKQLVEGNTVVLKKVVEQTMRLRFIHKTRRYPESITDMTFETYSILSSDDTSTLLGRKFTFDDQIVNSNAYRRALAKISTKVSTKADKAMAQGSDDGHEETNAEGQSADPGSDATAMTMAGLTMTDVTSTGTNKLSTNSGSEMTLSDLVSWMQAKSEFTEWATYWQLTKKDFSDRTKAQVEIQNVLMEVLQTEEMFIRGLLTLKYLFAFPTAFLEGIGSFAQEVFGDVDKILELHRTHLFEPLRSKVLEQGPWVRGNWEIFKKFFVAARTDYLWYASNYKLLEYRIQAEERQNAKFRSLMESCQSSSSAQMLC